MFCWSFLVFIVAQLKNMTFVVLWNEGIFAATLKEGGGGFRFCHIDVKHENLSMDVTPNSVFPSWFFISDDMAITACSEQQKNYIHPTKNLSVYLK